MSWNYLPLTEEERSPMLQVMGVNSVEELFADIRPEVRLERELNLPEPLPEPELKAHMHRLAAQNANLSEYVSFLGAGVYEHYIPSVVSQMVMRNEFYTAYTPYQAEMSQGVLQATFEYQTMICRLTGMEVANASLYDGATAVAEAAIMSLNAARGREVIVSETVNPVYRQVLETYITKQGFSLKTLPYSDGLTDFSQLESELAKETACLIVQSPNFFGVLEDLASVAEQVRQHNKKALLVVVADPISLGLLEPPASWGADIVVGEGQSLGNPTSFGGPLLGYIAARRDLVRRMPGRIVGQTKDKEGNRGFVLTLQSREQHIRRERATSNICSNQALNALAAAVYLTVMGPKGLRQVAELSLQKAHYAQERICKVPGFVQAFVQPFFKEFVIKCKLPVAEVNAALLTDKIIGGLDLGRFYPEMKDHMLLCVTEKRTKAEIDTLVARLEGMA
ncbi:MAG: aminomethyl-transferring glycine dehydrogenase subunit GcvPA [bacterium]|jgi:glycine dehydrogenase subunit 1